MKITDLYYPGDISKQIKYFVERNTMNVEANMTIIEIFAGCAKY